MCHYSQSLMDEVYSPLLSRRDLRAKFTSCINTHNLPIIHPTKIKSLIFTRTESTPYCSPRDIRGEVLKFHFPPLSQKVLRTEFRTFLLSHPPIHTPFHLFKSLKTHTHAHARTHRELI